MTDWQVYKTIGGSNWNSFKDGKIDSWFRLSLDKHVEYKDKYEKYINLAFFSEVTPCGVWKGYIEIDLDETKHVNSDYVFGSYVWRKIPQELVKTRLNMLDSSSINQTALAINHEGMDRVDRGEQATFIYQMEENGIKHSWTYKQN